MRLKNIFNGITFLFFIFYLIACKQDKESLKSKPSPQINSIKHAKGLIINTFDGYSVVKVINPWPKATENFLYILKQKNAKIPDSLSKYTTINVPIASIIVTSTTHIPSLEMLGSENSLIGFPHLDYISSEKIRNRIDLKKVAELGNNQDLNIEKIIDLQPSVIIGYGIDNRNLSLENLKRSGLKVVLNGDWNEQTPLGRAEWIKLFGVLFCKEKKADSVFKFIENEYNKTVLLAKKAKTKPTVLSGDLYQGVWYMPQGNSWGSQILKQAGTKYLWQQSVGTGSLSLSFESVFEKAQNAGFWFTSGQFSTLKAMNESNIHYKKFKAFQQKKVYSFASKKGKTGGILFYELAPNRPDLVLQDILKIVHPDLLPNYKLFFFDKLQ